MSPRRRRPSTPAITSSSSAAASAASSPSGPCRHKPVRVTIIDRTNHHLFQPLLYQVATGILSEGQIAPAIRDVLRNFENVRVVLGAVQTIDLEAKEVHVDEFGEHLTIGYDSLIVAGGAATSYFGHDDSVSARRA